MNNFEVILTGTGYPRPDAKRAGPGTLVLANGLKLQFDCGRGTTMRLAALEVLPAALDALFFTHYHSDHMTDLIDILMTRWILETEPHPLRIYGPESFRQSLELLQQALAPDVQRRKQHSQKAVSLDVEFREFRRPKQGVLETVLEDKGVRVLASGVEHGNVLHAVGYRIEYGGKVIAISGDTTYSDGVVVLAKDADVFVCEIIDDIEVTKRMGGKRSYILDYHSTPQQVAAMATKARAKKLVLTHIIPTIHTPEQDEALRSAVAQGYDGPILVGHDLTRVSA